MRNSLLCLSFVLISCNAAFAQAPFALLETDKSTTLDIVALKSETGNARAMVITDAPSSSKIKLTPYLLTIKNQIITERKPVALTPLCKKDEEKVNTLCTLSNGNILLLSSTDKKEYELAARVISPEGEVLKGVKVADNVRVNSVRLDLNSKAGEIRISYYDSDLKAQCFHFMNLELETVLQKQIVMELKSEKDYLFERILYDDAHAYCIDFNFLNKSSELGSVPQFLIYKIDINTGKLLTKTSIKDERHFTYPRYFIRNGQLHIFCMASPVYNQVELATIVFKAIKLDDLSMVKQHNIRNAAYGLIPAMMSASLEASMLNMTKDSAQRAALMAIIKSKEKQQADYKKNKMSSASNFQVGYNAQMGRYDIFYRMATESSYNTSEFNSSSGRNEFITYYSTSFGNTSFIQYDSDKDSVKDIAVFENAFSMGGNKFSKLYLTNKAGGDYSYTATANPDLFVFAYITGVEDIEHTVHFRIIEHGKLVSKSMSVKPGGKGNSFFYLKTMQEILPNVFICDVYTRGSGSRLLVVDLN